MKYLLLSLFAGVFSLYVHGVDNLRLPDVRSVGMGGNVATQSILFNPALIVDKEKKSIHLEYFNRYMLKELGTMSGSFYYPNQLLSAGVDISVFGFDKYREMMVRVLGGKRLGDQWALGLGVHYSFLQTDLLENTRSRLSTDIGITFSSIDKLLIGMLIMNFPSVSIGDKDIEIEGALLTMYDIRTNLSNQVVKEVKKYFNDKVYKNVIPRNVKLSEAPSYGMPISVYDPRSKGAKSYEKFVREFIKNNEVEGKGKHAM